MVSPVEKIMGRRQVDAEIKADPVTIYPMRKNKVNDGAGGWVWSEPELVNEDGFQVTIIPAKRRLSDMFAGTELGDVVVAPYIILGRHDVDLLRDDIFQWNGDDFFVKSIEIKTDVGITAQVDYLAGKNNVAEGSIHDV